MSVAPHVPAATDLLCEGCGYILAGLAETGNCPECGKPIAQSIGGHRRPSAFEAQPSLGSFLRTAAAVVFQPARFFSSLSTHQTTTHAAWFARCHRFVATTLLSVGICGLLMIDRRLIRWLRSAGGSLLRRDEPEIFGMMLPLVAVVIYLVMTLLARLAARVTAAMATRRGVRLHPAVVRRAMGFHAVHCVPVAFLIAAAVGGLLAILLTPMAVILYLVVALITVWIAGGHALPRSFRLVLGVPVGVLLVAIVAWYFNEFDGPRFDPIAYPPADWDTYRLTIAGAAVVGVGWLLLTGWLAMKNTMYANDRGARSEPNHSRPNTAKS